VSGSLSIFFWSLFRDADRSRVFVAEEVDGIGDKVSGDNTTVNVETLWKASV
jgi:hypothetical protein